MNVWSYWEGPKPAWISLCLETLRKNTPGIQILSKDTFREIYLGSGKEVVPIEKLNRQLVNVKSDFVRSWLLQHLGGIWVDADCICFRNLYDCLMPKVADFDFMYYEAKEGERVEACTALIGSKPDTVISRSYHNYMVNLLLRKHKLHRIEIGPWALWDSLKKSSSCYVIPTELVHPYAFWMQKPNNDYLLLDSNPIKFHKDMYCFMLTHNAIGEARNWTREQILESDTILGNLFRRAL